VGNPLEEAALTGAASCKIRIQPAGIPTPVALLTGIALPPTQRGK
jgi:hypothetical protein